MPNLIVGDNHIVFSKFVSTTVSDSIFFTTQDAIVDGCAFILLILLNLKEFKIFYSIFSKTKSVE